MNVLEKILEEMDNHAIEFELFGMCDDYVSVGWMKEIIRSYMNEMNNDGWISVEERLPEEGFYIATLNGEICGEEKPFVGLAEFENGKWVDDEEDYQCILAWKPLPEPYKGVIVCRIHGIRFLGWCYAAYIIISVISAPFLLGYAVYMLKKTQGKEK